MESGRPKQGRNQWSSSPGGHFQEEAGAGSLGCVVDSVPHLEGGKATSQHRFQLARAPVKLMGYGFQCSEPQVPDVGIRI